MNFTCHRVKAWKRKASPDTMSINTHTGELLVSWSMGNKKVFTR